MQGNGRRPLASLPLALGGIVAGHALAYALAYPIRVVRARADRPRRLLGPAARRALASGAAILSLGIRSIRRAPASPGAWALLCQQVPAFALLELAERGFDASVARDPAVVLGLWCSRVIAALARGAVAVGRLFATPLPRPARGRRTIMLPRLAEPKTPAIAIGLRRAPPAPSSV